MTPIADLSRQEFWELFHSYLEVGADDDAPSPTEALETIRQRITKALEDTHPDAISQPVRHHLIATRDLATLALVMFRAGIVLHDT